MKNVYIYCEGQIEEAFVNEILSPYFGRQNIWVRPIVCTTKRTAVKKYKGGVMDYGKIRKELLKLCSEHPNEYITTMFDYYAMPDNTPGIHCSEKDIQVRIKTIEQTIDEDIGQPNCRFHFMVHEFEGILFSNPDSFALIADNSIVKSIHAIRDSYPTPEHINNSPETAPSKRIEQLISNYAKIISGTLLAKDMGIDVILRECPHFREWIQSVSAFCK